MEDKNTIRPADKYSGVTTDKADNDKINEQLIEQETHLLNNNHANDSTDQG